MIHDVLVIGAGLAGLKAAGDLSTAGRSVLVLDKGRGVGGRAATRRWDGVPVDHGAQFFTARSEEFRAQAEEWQARGVCFPWAEGFSQWDDDGRGVRPPDLAEGKHPRYTCRAGMSALGKDLAARLPGAASSRLQARVVKVKRVADHWEAETEAPFEGGSPAGRSLVLTLPAPQAVVLLKDSGLFEELEAPVRSALEKVEYAPTLAVMLRGDAAVPDWQGIQLRDKTLSWISDDTGKRESGANGAALSRRVFVLHGTPDFSREWQDAGLAEATRRMVERAGEIVGDWIVRLPERQIHRWRYANVPRGVPDVAFLLGSQTGADLYFCGDAFLGAKIEGAYRSGLEAARDCLQRTSGVE